MQRVAFAIQQFAAVPEEDYPAEYLDEEAWSEDAVLVVILFLF